MSIRKCVIGIVVSALMLSALPVVGTPTSEDNARLRDALTKYPQADENGDGLLTLQEARAFRAKLRGVQGQRRGKPQRPPTTVSGEDVPAGDEVTGLNGLYMGHSFFRPVAEDLLEIVPSTRVTNHTEYIIMQGGQGGSPGFLWENAANREKGQTYLDRGDVDLLAMTYYSPADSSVEDYSRWIDYAIGKNPGIAVMITVPWAKRPHEADQRFLAAAHGRMTALHDVLIVALRRKYPDNRILYCPYGLGVYALIERLQEGGLPGVKYVLNPDQGTRAKSKQAKEQLVNDEGGHGGDLVARLGALLWLQTLYDYDVSALKPQTVEGLPEIDPNEIAVEVLRKIAPFNAVYQGVPAP